MATDPLYKLGLTLTIIIMALGTFFKMGVRSGRSEIMSIVPREQRPVIERVLRSGIDDVQIRKNQHELQEAQAAIENARKAHTRGDKQNALDWIINARGHLAKVNKKAFDITKLQAELQLLQRTMFSPRAQ